MRVSELAKELGVSSEDILAKLKSLKLKAKDGKQELNEAVIPVLRRELKGVAKTATRVSVSKEAAKPESKAGGKTKDVQEKMPIEATKVKAVERPRAQPAAKEKPESKTKTVVAQGKETKVSKIAKIKAAPQEVKKAAEEIKAVKAPLIQKPAPRVAAVGKPMVVQKVEKPVTPLPALKPAVSTGAKAKPVTAPAPTVAKPAAAAIVPPKKEEVKELEKPKGTGPLISLEIPIPIAVKDLSFQLQQKPSLILKSLIQMGIFANINQNLPEDIVRKVAAQFGFEVIKLKTQEEQLIKSHQAQEEDPKLLQSRSPVVTFMGHVDHGKTSLLDKIRKSRVVDEEHGGITQHIGAYSVPHKNGRITFLDTPGHEAFTAMRARGAHITDLVVLVVAADEGIMPQTQEAINHARAANVPILVALNKIDKKNADQDRVKKQLMETDLAPEDWGGKTICVGVSALTGQGIDQLLEMILLEAELLELKANPQRKASGIVVEAHLSGGRGAMATVIVQNGTLREWDILIVGPYYGRIKAMFDDHERPVKEAGPAMPVEILGLPSVPEAGESFYVVDNEKQAKEITEKRAEQIKTQRLEQSAGRLTLEDLYTQIQEGKIKSLSLILKADVQGSLEALKASLEKIPSDQVQLKFIHTGVGDINTSDVILASASNAIIIGFQVDTNDRAKAEIEKQSIDVRNYRIIYDAVNDITNALEGLLEPKMRKKFIGRVDIRQVFTLSRGIVAGCYVSKGKIHRKVAVDVLRNGQVVFSGKLSSLKRFKDDVREVMEGYECGLTVEGFDTIQVGDVVEAYEVEAIARKLVAAV